MKIEEVHQKITALLHNEGTNNKAAERKPSNLSSAATGDTVAISSTIRRLNTAMSFDEVQSVPMERIAMIKSMIQSGEYNVDGRVVAEKMVALVNKRA
jgi:flagellar biosynthesis anti-sigma factor FlgM